MQRLPIPISAVQLGTSPATVYTAPALTTATINNLVLTNTSAVAVNVTLYRVPAGGTAAVSNALLYTYTLSPNQSYVPPQAIGLQLSAGMTLQAACSSASAVTLMGGVYETSGS